MFVNFNFITSLRTFAPLSRQRVYWLLRCSSCVFSIRPRKKVSCALQESRKDHFYCRCSKAECWLICKIWGKSVLGKSSDVYGKVVESDLCGERATSRKYPPALEAEKLNVRLHNHQPFAMGEHLNLYCSKLQFNKKCGMWLYFFTDGCKVICMDGKCTKLFLK